MYVIHKTQAVIKDCFVLVYVISVIISNKVLCSCAVMRNGWCFDVLNMYMSVIAIDCMY